MYTKVIELLKVWFPIQCYWTIRLMTILLIYHVRERGFRHSLKYTESSVQCVENTIQAWKRDLPKSYDSYHWQSTKKNSKNKSALTTRSSGTMVLRRIFILDYFKKFDSKWFRRLKRCKRRQPDLEPFRSSKEKENQGFYWKDFHECRTSLWFDRIIPLQMNKIRS